MSDTSLEDNYIEQLLETLYKQAGLTTGQNMNFDAFKKIFASDEYEQTLEKATLTLQGNKTRVGNLKNRVVALKRKPYEGVSS